MEIYDFNYDDPGQSGGRTLFSHMTTHEKQYIGWNPRRNVLAFGGKDQEGGTVTLVSAANGAAVV